MSIFAVIVLVRIIWWVVQAQSAAPRGRVEEVQAEEYSVPQRPQLGGYGIAAPEEPDAR